MDEEARVRAVKATTLLRLIHEVADPRATRPCKS
jgi:hypothetical protein